MTQKGAESAISTLYQNQLAAKNQIEHSNRKPAIAKTSVDLQANFPVASKKWTAKQVKPVNREQQNTKKPVVDAVESSSISNKETKVNQKAEKRKSAKMAFSNLAEKCKANQMWRQRLVKDALSIAIKLPYICFFSVLRSSQRGLCIAESR